MSSDVASELLSGVTDSEIVPEVSASELLSDVTVSKMLPDGTEVSSVFLQPAMAPAAMHALSANAQIFTLFIFFPI